MSRMYHNEPLSALPVKTHNVTYNWDIQKYEGCGVILEGVIQDRSRHAILDKSNQKYRYYILHVKCIRCHKRKFDPQGKEIEPNFSETEKVRQGYLHSSYKTVPKGETDLITTEHLKTTLVCPELSKLQPENNTTDIVQLWAEETKLSGIELNSGDRIRVKTQADCPFIEGVTRLEGQSVSVGNYVGGDQVGASWTDKVMSAKSNATQLLPQDMVEGVDDDEWDD